MQVPMYSRYGRVRQLAGATGDDDIMSSASQHKPDRRLIYSSFLIIFRRVLIPGPSRHAHLPLPPPPLLRKYVVQ